MIFLYYIQETDKPNFIFQLFHIIQLKEDKIILPMEENNQCKKRAKKLAQKTKKVLDKTVSKTIVISKEIQKQKEYVNLLHSYCFEIVEGKWLFEALSCQVLDYILQKKAMEKKDTQVSILVNDLTENMLCNIKKIAKEYKRVNIVTNHLEKFRKIEKQLLDKDGIMITVGNNKKKGLSKSNLILNVDFPSELVNQYTIYENAIIVNIRGNVKIKKKRFNGISIHDYEIAFDAREEFDYDKDTKYKKCEIYEAQFNKKQPWKEVQKQIEKDKVKITQLTAVSTIL